MNNVLLRWSVFAFVVGTLTVFTAGCILSGGGYGYDGGMEVGVGAAYYEPYGVEYGGWGPGYQVAPFRGGGHRHPGEGSHAAAPANRHTPAYRPAPASRSIPSLPSHSRSGGSRIH